MIPALWRKKDNGRQDMLGKIRKKLKGKKGFTMVELIVVIVIILVLAAALVPQLLKYVEKAREANCKNEAATLLAQIQADYVASQATETGVEMPSEIQSVTIEESDEEITKDTAIEAKNAKYYVSNAEGQEGEITCFIYANSTHKAWWIMDTGWGVGKK